MASSRSTASEQREFVCSFVCFFVNLFSLAGGWLQLLGCCGWLIDGYLWLVWLGGRLATAFAEGWFAGWLLVGWLAGWVIVLLVCLLGALLASCLGWLVWLVVHLLSACAPFLLQPALRVPRRKPG